MCHTEHQIKPVLAFSTISHSGLMLIPIALCGPLGVSGFLLYVAGHAFVKSSLFFVSGIFLHRFRTASEHLLFAHGRGLWLSATLWFLGGLGLADV
jgi:multicomponent Na+:H+ antiporter subunit D